MAYYDRGAATRKEEAAKKFEELKEFISNTNDWYKASEHIMDMEGKIKEQEKQLEEYRSFFSLMRKLLPKEFSMHTPLI